MLFDYSHMVPFWVAHLAESQTSSSLCQVEYDKERTAGTGEVKMALPLCGQQVKVQLHDLCNTRIVLDNFRFTMF